MIAQAEHELEHVAEEQERQAAELRQAGCDVCRSITAVVYQGGLPAMPEPFCSACGRAVMAIRVRGRTP